MKLNLKLMSFFAAVAVLTSCSKDDELLSAPENGETVTNKPLDSDQTYYVSIAIGDASNNAFNSRTESSTGTEESGVPGDYNSGNNAGDFDVNGDPNFQQGRDEENAINTLFLLFYDADGNRVGNSVLVDQSSVFSEETKVSETGSTYQVRKGVVQVNLSKGENTPTQVIAVINPVSSDWTSPSFQLKMNKLQDVERLQLAYVRTISNFAMSNSVYYDVPYSSSGPNNDTQKNATPVSAVKINTNVGLFSSQQEAETSCAKDEFSFDIYVERYAAKVNFAINETVEAGKNNSVKVTLVSGVDASTGNSTSSSEATLNFKPDYWWVNAQETTTYMTKSFFAANGKTVGETLLTYDNMWAALGVNAMNRTWQWNSQAHHRSYWAQSPAYYAQSYPRVSDDIMDLGEYEYKDKVHKPSTYSLKYYTYNEIKNYNEYDKEDYKVSEYSGQYARQYAKETTMSSSALDPLKHTDEPNYNYKAAIPSVVVTGKYTLEGEGVSLGSGNTTFYVQGSSANGYYVYNERDMRNIFIYKAHQILSSTNPTASSTSGKVTPISTTLFDRYFVLDHPNKATRLNDAAASVDSDVASASADDELIIDARFVAMQVNDKQEVLESGDANKIFVLIDNKWQPFNPADKEQVIKLNRLLISNLGLTRKFDDGLAYFNIPIKHLRFNIKTSDSYNYANGKPLEPSDKDYNWSQVRLGDFGIVRNHIYTINVTNILGLGTGIADPDAPIVPPVDEEEYYAATRINILNWALVPIQDVEL